MTSAWRPYKSRFSPLGIAGAGQVRQATKTAFAALAARRFEETGRHPHPIGRVHLRPRALPSHPTATHSYQRDSCHRSIPIHSPACQPVNCNFWRKFVPAACVMPLLLPACQAIFLDVDFLLPHIDSRHRRYGYGFRMPGDFAFEPDPGATGEEPMRLADISRDGSDETEDEPGLTTQFPLRSIHPQPSATVT
jgi:hypothetical protein